MKKSFKGQKCALVLYIYIYIYIYNKRHQCNVINQYYSSQKQQQNKIK